jgi:hypothetical protein
MCTINITELVAVFLQEKEEERKIPSRDQGWKVLSRVLEKEVAWKLIL